MKRNANRKIIGVLLLITLIISVLTMSSCNRKYDEAEVEEATRKLLKEAELLNKLYYGSGIKYFDSEENGYYKEADPSHLGELGFSDINGLKALTEKTFSDEYSNLIYTTILSAMTDGTSIISAARYYQAYDEETKEPTHIMVYSNFKPMFKDTLEYDYGSIRVEKSKKEKVFVSVNATVTTSEGKSQSVEITVILIEEEDGWKIDNPTYANYNELKDKYDELKNQDLK